MQVLARRGRKHTQVLFTSPNTEIDGMKEEQTGRLNIYNDRQDVRHRNRLHTLKGTLKTLGLGLAERPGGVSNDTGGGSRNGGD